MTNLKAEMYLDIINDKLKICARAPKVVCGNNFKILGGIWFKPQELVDLVDAIIFVILKTVIRWK